MTYTTGLHHITAICSTPKENVRFYTEVLGLALVKQTVNQDDPTTYHLYYADKQASPGALMTFFPWMHLPRAQPGVGESRQTSFSIPEGSLSYWQKRLEEHSVQTKTTTRFNEKRLEFRDAHGLPLALVETGKEETRSPATTNVPEAYAIRGFRGVTLQVRKAQPTKEVLLAIGYEEQAQEDSFTRLTNPHSDFKTVVDLDEQPSLPPARQGLGATHHVAFRAKNYKEQRELKQQIENLGLQATESIDRFYFKSVYFKEPSGVLFEIATDGPGFAVDEPADKLGEQLVLPPWLEKHRAEIQQALPPLN